MLLMVIEEIVVRVECVQLAGGPFELRYEQGTC